MSGGFEVGDLLRIYCEKESNPLWEKGHAAFKMLDPFAREGNLVWVIDEAEPVRTFSEALGQELSRPDQYLKVRLTNPEKLNSEVFKYLKNGEHQIDEGDPITSSGWVLYYDDAIYYLPENPQDFIRQFDKILLEDPERKTNWKVEEHEQTEVNRIITALHALYGEKDEAVAYGAADEIAEELRKAQNRQGFLKLLWEIPEAKEYHIAPLLKNYNPGDYVYDKVEEYIYSLNKRWSQTKETLNETPLKTLNKNDKKNGQHVFECFERDS